MQWVVVNEGKVFECSFNHSNVVLAPAQWEENGDNYILKNAVVQFFAPDTVAKAPLDPIITPRGSYHSDEEVMKLFEKLDGLVNPKPVAAPLADVPLQSQNN